MTQNLFKKTAKIDAPYALYAGQGVFGYTLIKVLKAYQAREHEKKNQYARWFVAAKSDHTCGGWDMGDSYIEDVLYGKMGLVECTKEWAETYPEHVTANTVVGE